MFFPYAGVIEDAATDIAANTFAYYLLSQNYPLKNTHYIEINQGIEMDRPSKIYLKINKQQQQITSVDVSGSAVLVSNGDFFI